MIYHRLSTNVGVGGAQRSSDEVRQQFPRKKGCLSSAPRLLVPSHQTQLNDKCIIRLFPIWGSRQKSTYSRLRTAPKTSRSTNYTPMKTRGGIEIISEQMIDNLSSTSLPKLIMPNSKESSAENSRKKNPMSYMTPMHKVTWLQWLITERLAQLEDRLRNDKPNSALKFYTPAYIMYTLKLLAEVGISGSLLRLFIQQLGERLSCIKPTGGCKRLLMWIS